MLFGPWLRFRDRLAKCKPCSSRFRRIFVEKACPILARCIFFRPVYLLLVFIIGLIVGEALLPHLSYSEWSQTLVEVEMLKNKDTLRILFLGNVELKGRSSFAQWDSDRFLIETYSRAVDMVKPHVILAIGDLFPDGPPVSRDFADETLTRFDRIFKVQELIEKHGTQFSIYLGDLDSNFLNGACQPECSDLVQNYQKLIAPQCQFYANGSLLVRRFYRSFDKLDDPKCSSDGKSYIRVVVQQEPILPAMLAMLRNPGLHGPAFMYEANQKTLSIVRDFAPQLVVTTRDGMSGIVFCSNCMSMGAGGQPTFPQLEWIPVKPGTKPLVFRMPSLVDGGGRGGPQPHLNIPPVSYHYTLRPTFGVGVNFFAMKSGYAFGAIDRSSQSITYFVLWNYDRASVISCYVFFIYLVLFRFAVYALLKAYIYFNLAKFVTISFYC